MFIEFEKVLKEYNITPTGVVQIGAHYGQEYKIYKKSGIKNLIFFEPLKETFSVLSNNVPKSDDILLINSALGNFVGEVEMFVETANKSQSSSILKPRGHKYQYPHIKFNKKEKVKITTLDDFFTNVEQKHNVVCIDVQGYELEVFKGAEKSLKNIDLIISEVNRAELYKGNAYVNDLDKFLERFNFKRVETNWVGQTWGDAVYIKEEIND